MERLKYKPKNTHILLDSYSIKITFESTLLPEFMYIWRMRHRVSPFIQSVRRCLKCARIGHSMAFCRSQITCNKCSMNHLSSDCTSDFVRCVNCGGEHQANDILCPDLEFQRTINIVMAYTNSSRAAAMKLLRNKNISSGKQAEEILRSYAYLAWNGNDRDYLHLPHMGNEFASLINHPSTPTNFPSRKQASGIILLLIVTGRDLEAVRV